ncbi:MAG TPA: hypothetical protein DCM28_20450 [Phycisphaerales bacterium]|nr:hypothetical protein [Phycisphaerales bacterium]HCD31523.1 hypothetical protein [Phycisphaerales bacterium]
MVRKKACKADKKRQKCRIIVHLAKFDTEKLPMYSLALDWSWGRFGRALSNTLANPSKPREQELGL